MKRIWAAYAVLLLSTTNSYSSENDPKIFACTVDAMHAMRGGKMVPSEITEKSFVAKLHPARVTGKKPTREYHAAELNLKTKFAHAGSLRLVSSAFFGATYVQEYVDSQAFEDGKQRAFLGDERNLPVEKAVQEIRIEGHYVNLADSFFLFRDDVGRLTYILRAREENEKLTSRIAYGHCTDE